MIGHWSDSFVFLKRNLQLFSISLACLLGMSPFVYGQLTSLRVGSGFTNPLFATAAPGEANTLYVVEQAGLVRPLNLTTGTIGSNFLDLASVPSVTLTAGGERGLLGFAFDPNYLTNHRFFVYYTDGGGNIQIDRFTSSGGVAVPGSRTSILNIPRNPSQANHNGGWMGFSPTDGFLYIGVGDGGGGNDPFQNGQNINSLQGKMLRIDVSGSSYTSPSSNPFAGATPGADEIYAFGLRNPFRNSFDRANGNFYIADVGQSAREEVNFKAAATGGGQNYGWRAREGRIRNTSVPDPDPTPRVEPIYDYDHGIGQSITGGYVYRGGNYLDGGISLDGTYLFGDFVSQRIFSFRYTGTDINTNLAQDRTSELQVSSNGFTINNISSFGEDLAGNLYVVDYGGEIFQIRGVAVPEPGSITLLLITCAGVVMYVRSRKRLQDNILTE